MRHFPVSHCLGLLLVAGILPAQQTVDFEQRKGLLLQNDRIELITLAQGGAFVSLVLKDDPEKMNPMWNPIKSARDLGKPSRFGSSLGHFVCVDGFGGVSREEQAAGLRGHGEAHRLDWELVASGKQGNRTSASFQVTLPLVQEIFRRKVSMADGESVVLVESELESLLAFDRAINWAEHATIGIPFLTPEKTVVDASVGRCQTRPHANQPSHRLASDKEFTFPMAPKLDGSGTVDTRFAPANPNSMDHSGCAMDASRSDAWVTALRTDKRLLIGYLWPRPDYPWLQQWMNFTAGGDYAWGLEFGTQPFDVSRRQTLEMGSSLFGVPAFRILPAKAKITAKFLMFLARVPDGFTKVDDVRHEAGKIVIEDRKAGKRAELAATIQ
jgi:hypothetical protein